MNGAQWACGHRVIQHVARPLDSRTPLVNHLLTCGMCGDEVCLPVRYATRADRDNAVRRATPPTTGPAEPAPGRRQGEA